MHDPTSEADGPGSAEQSTGRIGRNVAALLLTHVGARGIGFVTTLWLASALGPAAFGVLGYVQSWSNVVTQIAGQGFQAYGIRELAGTEGARSRRRLVWEIGLLNLLAGLAACAVFLALAFTLGGSEPRRAVFLLWLPIVLVTTFTPEWVATGEERMGLVGATRTLRAVIYLALAVVLVRSADELGLAVLSNVAGTSLAWLVLLAYTVARYSPIAPTRAGISTHVRSVGFFAASTLFIEIFNEMDTVMLGILTDDVQVGLYVAPYRIVWTIVGVAGLFATAFMPAVARTTQAGRLDERAAILGVYTKLMAIGAAAAWALAVRAESIMAVTYGEAYMAGVPAFRILLVTAGVMSLNLSVAHSLLYAGHHKLYMRVMAGAAAGNIVLNLLLIPRYGALGAAVATLVAELTILALAGRAYRRELGTPRFERGAPLKLVALTAALLGTATLAGALPPGWALAALLAVCAALPVLLGLIRPWPPSALFAPPTIESDDDAPD